MGKMMFGHQETVTCIQDIPLSSPAGEELCLAHKTSGYFVVAGVYFQDDGYVLRPRHDKTKYIEVGPAELQAMQQEGTLPTPLPAYSIAWYEYAFGYSLWLAIVGVLVWGFFAKVVGRRSRERDDATAVGHGPPAIRTKVDAFVQGQVQPLLRPGETVQHQAYTLASEPGESALSPAYYAVLTSQRLIFIEARQGAFGPLLENKGVTEIDRRAITEVFRDGRAIVVHARGPIARMMWVHRTGKLSNQAAFLRDVHRLLQADLGAAGAAPGSTATAA